MDTAIDRRKVRELLDLTGGDTAFLEDLLQTYVDDTSRRLGELGAACQEGPAERVHRAAHGIKGSSSNIGAAEMVRCCVKLEQLARAHDLASARQAFHDIEAAFRAVVDDIPAALRTR
ncbi:MAG: Hpt domain-containing protein [Myxococcales bacterium]|nr:Hpt domain-containing protein [Myxococcales bacterium]